MRTAAEAVEWARQHPTRDGGTWSQWCQSFVVRALDLRAAGDANQACLASTIQSNVAKDAPTGAIHWWLTPSHSSGHVGVGLGGEQVLMTDAPAADQWAGHHTVGITTVTRYGQKGTSYRYVGWSLDMAGQPVHITTTNPAGGGTTPIPAPTMSREDTMHLAHVKRANQTVYALFSERAYTEFIGQEAANAFASQIGNSAPVSESFLTNIRSIVTKNGGGITRI